MANETKVGLLVGMSFIIVFALLLANRGSKQTPAVVRKPAAIRGQLVRPDTVSSVEERMKTAALGSGETTPDVGQSLPESPATLPQVKQAEDRQPDSPDSVPPASAFKRLEDQIRYSPMPKPSQSGFAEARPDLSDWKNEGVLESVEESKATVLMSKLPEPPVHDATSDLTHEEVLAGRSHVVKKGETLYKIARDVYGSSSKDVIDQIYMANRGTLKSPNNLSEGDKLVLPEIAGDQSSEPLKPAPASSAPDNADKKADSPGPAKDAKDSKQKKDSKGKTQGKKVSEDAPKFRWYQVGKGDRFTTIAAKQMGDSGKWQQLADFNKDIFPNPAKIRPGVRIKIPVEKLASAN